MARIAGIDLPRDKRVEYALPYIYGIGLTSSRKILTQCGIDYSTRVRELSDTEIARLREVIENEYRIEGELRREVQMNIRRLMEIGCYRGLRHRKGLPVRGQRTRTNARTRKGKKRTVGTRKGKK